MKTSLMNHIDDGNALLNSMIPMIPKKLEDGKRSIATKRIHDEMMHLNSKRSMIPMMPKKRDDIHHQIMQLKSILNFSFLLGSTKDVLCISKAINHCNCLTDLSVKRQRMMLAKSCRLEIFLDLKAIKI